MDALDFSALSDDQLLTLIRAALREAADRHPAVAAAAEAATLDEAERIKIMSEAGEREAAALRAKEREKLAREAAEAVRAKHAAEQSTIYRARAKKAAELARDKAAQALTRQRDWLQRASTLVGVPPSDLSLVVAPTQYGRRVLINLGGKYERAHLSDWNAETGAIKTPRELVSKKPDLAALSAEFAAIYTNAAIIGSEIF
jgi:hypothetical protein